MGRESAEALGRLFTRLVRDLGPGGAEQMMTVVAEEIGGIRLIFPTIQSVARMVRNQQICAKFNGVNYEELGIRYRLSTHQIRHIVNQQAVYRE